MNNKKLKIAEIIGVPVIYLIAVVLHFVYDLSNGSVLSILFGAVNESVWEHVKIFAAGYTIWAMIELLWLKPHYKKFVVAKTVSIYFLCLSIILFFYGYNIFTPKPWLWLDILSSFVFVVLSQILSYRLITCDRKIEDYFPISAMALMMLFVMFFCFTVYPPKIDLFRDPVTGGYGIVKKYVDTGAFYLDKTYKM